MTQRDEVYAALSAIGQSAKELATATGLSRQVCAKHLRSLWLDNLARVTHGVCQIGSGGGTPYFVWIRK